MEKCHANHKAQVNLRFMQENKKHESVSVYGKHHGSSPAAKVHSPNFHALLGETDPIEQLWNFYQINSLFPENDDVLCQGFPYSLEKEAMV